MSMKPPLPALGCFPHDFIKVKKEKNLLSYLSHCYFDFLMLRAELTLISIPINSMYAVTEVEKNANPAFKI